MIAVTVKPTLTDVQAAAARLVGKVRRTPMLRAEPTKHSILDITHTALWLKLEHLQITGSFKARGAMNAALQLSEDQRQRGLITASGGNHGLALAHAGWRLGASVTVYLPANAPMSKEKGLQAWGATVIRHGAVWDDANAAALEHARRTGANYIHAFEHPDVISAQGTQALEILSDVPNLDVLVVAIGGGGLISGVSLAAKAINPKIKVIGVEPMGAPTLHDSILAGQVITLDAITTAANTLAPRRSSQINFEIIRDNVDAFVLVSDDEMREAARWLWREFAIGAELSGAASVAALMCNKIQLGTSQRVCAIVCGAGTDGMT
jgi:threonine dehydratase